MAYCTYFLLALQFTWMARSLTAHIPAKRMTISHIGHHRSFEVVDHHQHGFTPAPHVTKVYRDICSQDAECVLPVQCPAHVHDDGVLKCKTILGRVGICCKTGQNHTALFNEKVRGHHVVHADLEAMGDVTRRSRLELSELHLREMKILTHSRSALVPLGTASYGHFRNSRLHSMHDLLEVMSVANRALEIALATRAFKDRQGVTNQQLEYGMIHQDLSQTPLGAACVPPPVCPPVPPRFRKIDGSCNNINNPSWGMPLTPYSRLLPPVYHDGIWTPRVSEDQGQPLTSPRLISTTLFSDEDIPNPDYTLMLMQFGQFISHDITQSLDTSFANGSAISCCSEDGSAEIPHEFRHFACFPVVIPRKDPFFGRYSQGCMNFVRSVLAPRHDCTLGYAQQMNKVSHYIDGSAIYGSSPDQTRALRSFEFGQLTVFDDFGRHLLPLSEDPDACLTTEQGSACFTSGDTRTNQMVSLTVLHTLFMREHNRIANELAQINPHWQDERIFLVTRQIIIAELQVVTYGEYLPALLGEAAMEEFDLLLERDDSYSYDYNQKVDPSAINEFASAAFRFGHSMVDGVLKIYGKTKLEAAIDIPEVMFHPARMRKHEFYDQMLTTMTTDAIQDVDNSMSDSLTKYMFRAGNPFGVDLAAINIQRGRDHGLRPYNDYRELVGQPRIKSFEEFGPELGERLKSVYVSVDDIDLWVGGLLEPKYGDSVLGLTFRDIIAEQFSRLKQGDKYFFEHDPTINPGYFTPEQLVEIRKVTLSRIICDNRDGILLVRQAPNAFRKPGLPGNEYVDCTSPALPHMNLLYWQD
ncbi:hypothetical protein PPYR_04245 [Photinus pyralis]|uniref:Chorion peroxidase n=1 Tax=Photinus pyralis TaxID=7054 RepID=A0A5N4AXJ2_PHOPY|nr:chorion peroxidase [Photinus pyralis]KAB0802059.1 hypothetical protein PPYR_04245 [Photinus pyralis]